MITGDARIIQLATGPFQDPLPTQPTGGGPVGGHGIPHGGIPHGGIPHGGIPRRAPGDVHPVLRRAAAPPAALDLLAHAHRTLDGARTLADPLERYAAAHLAALRTSAAVLAVRGRPEQGPRRRKAIRSAWEVLPEVAPELAEWALYFAAGARKRAAAEAGIQSAASPRDADDLVRNTALFLRIVERLLSLRPALPAPALPFDDPRDGEDGGAAPPMPRTG
ncbi:SAV_6107 family HEPN domain-containing protein [Streptomyces sp. NPDC092296]|uniref:SAV_6107 family HEPN domain-containing protein n=1 Tax=Streptomyces sp. NPDC092296 TaxID=3366012 RepID=UPI003813EEC0